MVGSEARTRARSAGIDHPGRIHPSQQAVFARSRLLPTVTFTTATGAHSFIIHPVIWLGSLLALTCLLLGAVASGLYMAYHDDIIELAINRPIRMEQAYEDRIAALRSEVDRINSRQLLDQDAFEAKIGQLMARQETLRAQQTRVAGLMSRAHDQHLINPQTTDTGEFSDQLGGNLIGTRATRPSQPTEAAAPAPTGPHPIEDTPLRSSWLYKLYHAASAEERGGRSAPGLQIARVEAEIDRMKSAQVQSLMSLTDMADTNSRTIERAVNRLGLHIAGVDLPSPPVKTRVAEAIAKMPQSADATQSVGGVGGPLVPILDEGQILTQAEVAVSRFDQLKAGVGLLPIGTPLNEVLEVTSPFGERPDPFLGVEAMHTGIDFRASYGEPVLATAPGTVTEASRQGGYGNMVEIDHGSGLATRYGHLSQFAVIVGQKVRQGQIVGYVGSTGRSTAAHLHYETRVGGVAVNPETYLQAGTQIRPLLD